MLFTDLAGEELPVHRMIGADLVGFVAKMQYNVVESVFIASQRSTADQRPKVLLAVEHVLVRVLGAFLRIVVVSVCAQPAVWVGTTYYS